MKKESDLEAVKRLSETMLMTKIHKTQFSPIVVQHPFTSSGVVAVMKNGSFQMMDIMNSKKTLKEWQTYMKHEIQHAESIEDIYYKINKPYLLTFLERALPHLSSKDFSSLLADAWMRSEYPNCDASVNKEQLVRMFKQADPNELMDEEEKRKLFELDETVTVWRGVTSYNADNVKALSWTLDRDVAKWFAHRFVERGTVYKAKIHRSHILALFSGRNESEVIVDPSYLMDIRESEEINQSYQQHI